jgi:hypothetical protein
MGFKWKESVHWEALDPIILFFPKILKAYK